MEDPRIRYLGNLINSMNFLIKRMRFHQQQIHHEQVRLCQSVQRRATKHRQLEQLGQIVDFNMLLIDSERRVTDQLATIQQFLDLNEDLNYADLYKQAQKQLEEMKKAQK